MHTRLLSLTVAFALAGPLAAEPIKLLPIGDSITQGRSEKGPKAPATFSWRYPLWQMFVDAGIDVDFIGSLHGGFEGDPDWASYKGKAFDRDHEGHWGWTPAAVRDRLEGWMKGYAPPDLALILLGTNGADKPDAIQVAVQAHRDMIRLLRERNPRVVVAIGLPFQDWKPFPEMRDAYRKLAAELNAPESPVLVVDHSGGWIAKPTLPDTDTVDWVHPNANGDRKIAARWFEALMPIVQRKSATPSK